MSVTARRTNKMVGQMKEVRKRLSQEERRERRSGTSLRIANLRIKNIQMQQVTLVARMSSMPLHGQNLAKRRSPLDLVQGPPISNASAPLYIGGCTH